MLAQPKHVEADLVGQLDLLDQVAQPLMRADGAWAWFRADVGEGVETEFHHVSSSVICFSRYR